jgi:MSHA biogenesis protein MshP
MSPRIGFKFQVSSFTLHGSLRCRPNLEPETLNFRRRGQHGFSIVTAVFLVVILSLLGVFIISVTGLQQAAQTADLLGVRAYQAARTGIEWAAWQVLDPNNDLPGVGGTANLPPCPGATVELPVLAGSLSAFTVTVTCAATTTTEGNRNIAAYQIVATACNQPLGASPRCPNTGTPAAGYVERQLQAVLSKCKDPSAAAPRFACG